MENDKRKITAPRQNAKKLMICPNCERQASWTRRRCAACRTKFPAWYVIATVVTAVCVYVAFLVVEQVF